VRDKQAKGIRGVALQLFDSGDKLIRTVYTDSAGAYSFGKIDNGSYIVKILPPIGFQPDYELKQSIINHVPVMLDFVLSPLTVTGKIMNIWWWKMQLVYIHDGANLW